MIGYNFRMGEIEATIGIEQLKKLDYLVKSRQEVAKEAHRWVEGSGWITHTLH